MYTDTAGPGTDTITGSILDENNQTRTATATVTWGTAAPQADLSITKDDGVTSVHPGDTVIYTIVATNNGPAAATAANVHDDLPAVLENAQWTCAASAGSTCAAAGSGNIDENVDLLSGGTATFTVTGIVAATASGSLSNTATVTAPQSVSDPSGNNTATDTDTIVPNVTIDARPDHYITEKNTTLTVGNGVLANDTKTGASPPLQASLVTPPSNGAVVLNSDGSFAYTPAPGFVGSDSFTYNACSGSVCDSATVYISVVDHLTPTHLVAEPSVADVIPGLVVRLGFEARLTDTTSVVVGAPINFSINGVPTCSATTNADGVAACSADVPQLIATILAFGYEASFGGSITHARSSDHAPVIRAAGINILRG